MLQPLGDGRYAKSNYRKNIDTRRADPVAAIVGLTSQRCHAGTYHNGDAFEHMPADPVAAIVPSSHAARNHASNA